MPRKLYPVVISQSIDPDGEGLEVAHYGWTNQFRYFVGRLGNDYISTFMLDHRHNYSFVACTNDGIAFPMTHLASSFNMPAPIAQRTSVVDLPLTVTSARKTFPLLILAAQVLPKNPALHFARINILVHRLMAVGQLGGDLLGNPLQTKQNTGFFTQQRLNGWGVPTVLRSLYRELIGLFGSIAPRTSVAIQLPAESGLVPIQQLGYLRLIESGFYEYVNLISFSLAEVFVFEKQLRLHNAIHQQTSNLQLIEVVLRA